MVKGHLATDALFVYGVRAFMEYGMRPARNKAAFSLVEASIVLVVIGLLVGGILGGQSLVRGAEMRGMNAELQRYTSAVYNFKTRYRALPGDMTNATNYWGTDPLGCATYHRNTAPASVTCNGNGDNLIEQTTVDMSERFRAWQHLANAGSIEGSFTGTNEDTTNTVGVWKAVPGVNMPASTVPNGFWLLANYQATAGHHSHFDHGASTALHFFTTGNFALKPEDAWNADTKFDDGQPAYGKAQAYKLTATWGPNCTTSDTASTARYALDRNEKLCTLYVLLGI